LACSRAKPQIDARAKHRAKPREHSENQRQLAL